MPKKSGKHRLLGRLLWEMDIDQAWLAKKINRSVSYVSGRMNDGRWELPEVYAVGELLHISDDKLLLYFPNRGEDKLPSLRDEYATANQMCETT